MADGLLMCEFHDATFERITVDRSWLVRIHFSTLMCYYAASTAGKADVWICPAELQIADARRLTVNAPVHEADWVSDLELIAASDEPADEYNLALLQGRRLASARLIMVGEASIEIEGGVATLVLGLRRKLLETVDWP